jgi:hypothetical protein
MQLFEKAAARSAKRDQISAICNKTARSCGVSWWRANPMHASAKRRYSSHRSKGTPFSSRR